MSLQDYHRLFEVAALVFLVPNAPIRFDLIGFLAMEFLAVGTHIPFWLIALVFLLSSTSTAQLGTMGFLAIVSPWLEFFFK
jgi:hypothetical protein